MKKYGKLFRAFIQTCEIRNTHNECTVKYFLDVKQIPGDVWSGAGRLVVEMTRRTIVTDCKRKCRKTHIEPRAELQ